MPLLQNISAKVSGGKVFYTFSSTFKREVVLKPDANFVTDFGAEAFMERFWGGVGIQNGDEVVRLSGGFDSSYLGKRVCFKETDNTTVVGLNVATYATIIDIISPTVVKVDTTFDIQVTDGDGYFFADNSVAYSNAIAAADASGKNYRVYVPPSTMPYVIPQLVQVTGGGGILFVSDPSGTERTGGATFKIFEEDRPGSPYMFGTLTIGQMSSYTQGVENINICTRDNYSFVLSDEEAIFRYPTAGNTAIQPVAYLVNCDMSKEYNDIKDDATTYLTNKYGASNAAGVLDKNYNCATPTIIRSNAGGYGTAANPSLFYFEGVDFFHGRYFSVRFSLRNNDAELGSSIWVMKNCRYGGSKPSFRGGMFSTDTVKVSADVINDLDGDPTIISTRADSPRRFDFFSLFSSNYDAFQYRRQAVTYYWELTNGTLTKTGKNYEGACKTNTGKAQIVGTVAAAYDRGDGIYDVLINRDPSCNQSDLVTFGNNRVNGVVFTDYIGGDAGGTLSNVNANGSNSLVSSDRGELRDYKGWVRFVTGDTNERPPFLAEWENADRTSAQASQTNLFLAADNLDETINIGDVLAVRDQRRNSTTMTVTDLGGGDFGFSLAGNVERKDNLGWNNRFIQDRDSGDYVEIPDNTKYDANTVYTNLFPSWSYGTGTFTQDIWNAVTVNNIDSRSGEGTLITGSGGSIYYKYTCLPEARVKHFNPNGTDFGDNIFMLNIQVSPNKNYGGAPFTPGETLYAWFSGSGNDNWTRAGINRHRDTEFSINKWDIKTFNDGDIVDINYFNKSGAGGAPDQSTHLFYGSDGNPEDGSTLMQWEDTEWNGIGTLSLLFRRAGNAGTGNRHTFVNCEFPGNGTQSLNPVLIDGGESPSLNSGTDVEVRNKPRLQGTVTTGDVTDTTGDGYCINGVPQGGASNCDPL